MNWIKNYFRLFIIGFLLAFIMSNLTHCPEESPTNPGEEPAFETEQLKDLNLTTIEAFNSANKDVVLDLMYDEYKEIYGEYLDDNTDKMKAYAKALESRKIIFANDMYAEYEITIEGKVFTIAYSHSGDGNWKLHRF